MLSQDTNSFANKVEVKQSELPPPPPRPLSELDKLQEENRQLKILANEYQKQLNFQANKVKMYESAFTFFHSIIMR